MALDDTIKQGIIDAFMKFNPLKIILFGSSARGDADLQSDIDVIVVYRTEKRFMDRLRELYESWSLPKPVDILAYTPDEYEKMLKDSAFVQDAVKQGHVMKNADFSPSPRPSSLRR